MSDLINVEDKWTGENYRRAVRRSSIVSVEMRKDIFASSNPPPDTVTYLVTVICAAGDTRFTWNFEYTSREEAAKWYDILTAPIVLPQVGSAGGAVAYDYSQKKLYGTWQSS